MKLFLTSSVWTRVAIVCQVLLSLNYLPTAEAHTVECEVGSPAPAICPPGQGPTYCFNKPSGNTECGFASASAAKSRAVSFGHNYYYSPGGEHPRVSIGWRGNGYADIDYFYSNGDSCGAGATFAASATISYTCTTIPHYYVVAALSTLYQEVQPKGCPECAAGNPIDLASGSKFQVETDYLGAGLSFRRYYNSTALDASVLVFPWRHEYEMRSEAQVNDPVFEADGSLSPTSGQNFVQPGDACENGWLQVKGTVEARLDNLSTYARSEGGECVIKDNSNRTLGTTQVYTVGGPSPAQNGALKIMRTVTRADGRTVTFVQNTSGQWLPEQGYAASLAKVGQLWQFTDSDDTVTSFDDAGKAVSIAERNGRARTLAYSGGVLTSVTDSMSGRQLLLDYDTLGRLHSITDPAGQQYIYAYSPAGLLDTVTGPDGKSRKYDYSGTSLTGITDENGNPYATWTYDQGKAVTSEHAGGVDHTEVTFGTNTATVTEGNLAPRVYTFADVLGAKRVTNVTRSCPGCGTSSTTYDANGFVDLKTDFNGHITDYDYDARGLEIRRIEATGTTVARTTTTQWDSTFRLPLRIDEPGRQTTYTYDGNGNRLSQTVLDTTTGESRTTSWTYNSLGQVLTVNGPRTDLSDITTYTYNPNGTLAAITDALEHQIQITAYDAHGNPTRIIDANGVQTDLAYDLRQRLTSRSIGGVTTNFEYDGVGQLTKVTLPDDSTLSYVYDDAHRLIEVKDKLNNRIHYTLDVMGNRTKEEVFDPSNALKRKQTQVFNSLGRLQEIAGANGQSTTFVYDAEGNRTSQTEAGSFTTGNVFDELNRLKQVTDAKSGVTSYGYNALNQLTSVTDPNTLQTTYTLNALGDLKQQASPDTGTTSYTVDAAGNRKSQTDARGITANYSYDALNRLTAIDYPGTAEDVSYSYDGTNYSGTVANGVGRLTGIVDSSGTTTLTYDARGNLLRETLVSGAKTLTTSHSYNSADHLLSITYPSGRVVDYSRDSLGQVSGVTTTFQTLTTTLASSVMHLPFGPATGYTLGNGIAVSRAHDQDYRLTEYQDGTVQHVQLSYDTRNNITGTSDLVATGRSQTLGYDELSRLTSATGTYGARSFTYDPIGNRLSATAGATADTYSYVSGRNRLSATTSGASYSYDDAGNVLGDGTHSYHYNGAGRADAITGGTTAVSALYNAHGQRVKKTAGGKDTLFTYDRDGQLLAEAGDGPTAGRDYVWLEGQLLALETTTRVPDVIVDNTDVGFTTVGSNWVTQSSGTGIYGSNYRQRGPAANLSGATTVDDGDAVPQSVSDSGGLNRQATYRGTWQKVAATPAAGTLCAVPVVTTICDVVYSLGLASRGADVHKSVAADTAGSLVFSWRIPAAPGRYRVYASWPSYPAASHTVTYTISYRYPAAVVTANQSSAEAAHYLGMYESDGQIGIDLRPTGGSVALADMITIVPVENIDGMKAQWASPALAGSYDTYVRWPSTGGVSTASSFTATHATGSYTVALDQNLNPGAWNKIGTFSFNDPATQGVSLAAALDDTVLADAVKFTAAPGDEFRYSTAYFHVDQLGTPQKMTDASGNIVWDATYEPFGRATLVTHAIDNDLRFPGQYFDSETGLHQNELRDYDPSTGRYLQFDPIGLRGGINGYIYAKANPTRFTDRHGLSADNDWMELPGVDGKVRFPSRTPPENLPYDPSFGPENCGHYPPGSVLRSICEGSGNDPYTNCARKCLKEKYPSCEAGASPPLTDPWYWRDHPSCWISCQWGPAASQRGSP